MLLVKTKIGLSKIHGIGIFADQFIAKGTPVWKFQPGFDLQIDKQEIAKLSAPARDQFLKYTYLDPQSKKYILCFDDARFFNHADEPNCVDLSTSLLTTAGRDIEAGEELTCNYKDFDAEFNSKMRNSYNAIKR